MTRSMGYALRGMFHESLQFHPFGPVVLAAFLAYGFVRAGLQIFRSADFGL